METYTKTDIKMRLIFVFLALALLQLTNSCKDSYTWCDRISCQDWAYTSACRKSCGFCPVEGKEYRLAWMDCENLCTRETCQDGVQRADCQTGCDKCWWK